jgi:hypothetical protein
LGTLSLRRGERGKCICFSAAVDKKLKIACVSLKASKLLPLVVKQGRFLTASLQQFSLRFLSKAEREAVKNRAYIIKTRLWSFFLTPY